MLNFKKMDPIQEYYNSEIEKDRLDQDIFKLEGIRSKEIISRYLSKSPLNILDIGGGAGFYSFWLAGLGHNIHLIDLTPKNIELAKSYATRFNISFQSCETGNATSLRFPDNSFDRVLLMGPLYHLTEEKERIKALSEAKRVLKPGGFLLAAIITRYASLIDGFKRNLIEDNEFERILIKDLETGNHINTTDNPEYFTTAFFHTPLEIRKEIANSGLTLEKLIGIEGVGWLIDDFTLRAKNDLYWKKVNNIINKLESNDDLIAMSPLIMVIARK